LANIDGTSGDDTLNGTSGDDVITGFDGDDTIDGLGGNDTISGGTGADTINGGDGVDVLYSDTTSPLLGSGSDPILDHGTEIDTLVAGDGEDFLFAGYGDSADGGAGNDTLYVSFFAAPSGVTFDANLATQTIGGGTITGIENISWIEGSNYDDNFNLNSDFDTGLPGHARIYALSGNDVVIAGYSTWLIDGGAGDDTLDGRNSAYLDEIQGGDGNDTIYGSTRLAGGNIELNGGAGDDTIIGGTADELLVGGDGNDSITDGAGSDHVDAGAGNFDSIYASVDYSDDIFDGGDGTHDIVYFSNALAAVQANLTTGTAQSVAGEDAAGIGVDQLVNIEDLYGSAFDDIITGDAGDNGLFGRDGNDVLNGGTGADVLTGGVGNDILDGGEGNDLYMIGSAAEHVAHEFADSGSATDTDEVRFASTTAGETLRLYGQDLGVERVVIGTGTGASADTSGTTNLNVNASVLHYGIAIAGNDGVNKLVGSGFADTISGGGGDDEVKGKGGADSLTGGAGRDIFTGGGGSDIFVFADGDFGNSQATADKIADFHHNEADQIDLSLVDADTLLGGDQAFTFIGTSAFTHTAGELRYQEINGLTFLYGDMDGDGVKDMMIKLSGLHAMVSADFVL
jgi:Ca2+-binding RTX toxin-like protein